jgi:hypothetical protein
MLGLIALGGFVLIVLLVSVLVVTVLLLVLFVTIGSAAITGNTNTIQKHITIAPAITLLRSLSDIKELAVEGLQEILKILLLVRCSQS